MKSALSIALAVAGWGVSGAAWAQEVQVIIEADGADAQAALVARLTAAGATVHRTYQGIPAVAATVPADRLAEVAASAGVLRVTHDAAVSLPAAPDAAPTIALEAAGRVVAPLGVTSPGALPTGYVNFLLTGAAEIWQATGAGSGSVVAVVDTGTARNACIGHAVTGAPGFPEGFSSVDDGLLATSPLNEPHGTFVGGIIAAQCGLSLSPDDPLWLAIDRWLPGVFTPDAVPILGQAPLAQLYPVKVIDTNGSGSVSGILAGLDHVLTLKQSGALDIDVVNMSLGLWSFDDRRGPFAAMVTALHRADVLVVAAAGNSGPGPATVLPPAIDLDSIAVGALDYAVPSRVLYDYLGEAFLGAPGQAQIMRPTAETRVATFSSRGPTADGRSGPDIVALGTWVLGAQPDDSFSFGSGTSGASPAVAGVAALLAGYHEATFGADADAERLRRALLSSANPYEVAPLWQSPWAQGNGALDAPAALAALGRHNLPRSTIHAGHLHATALPPPGRHRTHTADLGTFVLAPGASEDVVIEVNEFTDRVVIEVTQALAPDNSATAIWPNTIHLVARSARRSTPQLGDELDMLYDPNVSGPEGVLVIEDGAWFLNGQQISSMPMQPGLLKLTVGGDMTNQDAVSLALRVTRSGDRKPLRHPVVRSEIRTGDQHVWAVEVPPGTAETTFDLVWSRDWSVHPTSDLDMVVVSPDLSVIDFSGTTFNAPERAIVSGPMPGEWLVVVDGYEVSRPDRYSLYVTHR